MEYLEILASITALVVAVFYLTLTVHYWQGRRHLNESSKKKKIPSRSRSSTKGRKMPWINFSMTYSNSRNSCDPSSSSFHSNWHDEQAYRTRARKLLRSVRRAAQGAAFTSSLRAIAEPLLRQGEMYGVFVEEMTEAMVRRRRFGRSGNCDPVDALMELLEAGPQEVADVKLTDVIVTAQIFWAFCKCDENAPDADELILERQMQKFGEEILKVLGGNRENSDEVENADNSLVKANEEERATPKIHELKDLSKYIIGQVFVKLTDPTVSVVQKVGYVSSFVLITVTGFTMKRFAKQIKSHALEVCKAK